MEKLNRKNFFSLIGKTTILSVIASALPIKFFNSVSKVSEKKITIKINPEAIKRNKV